MKDDKVDETGIDYSKQILAEDFKGQMGSTSTYARPGRGDEGLSSPVHEIWAPRRDFENWGILMLGGILFPKVITSRNRR